tara:strand:+ start:4499 stop:5692 length:1194 start_codon:yes stop_codon:yes gene_type:complete
MITKLAFPAAFFLTVVTAFAEPSAEQLAGWLKRFPDADTNGDGVLSMAEALDYRAKMQKSGRKGGAPREFKVDPGWEAERFPDHAVSYRSPEEIREIFGKVTSFPKPSGDVLRIVGTGHSFMAPGYGTLPKICRAAGFEQPLLTHTGGGITGSTRYKWEQENGIFQFDGKPEPKLLASIANAEWEAMMWGPYFNDRPAYYECWIDFCLKFNPAMKFYLSDAWPQLGQLDEIPATEDALTAEVIGQLGAEKNALYGGLVELLNAKYPGKVFILPTSDAMVLAAEHYLQGELPGVEGLHRALGQKEFSLWRDQLGHLGPGFERLEGYVFYATLYGRSPELIENDIDFGRGKNTKSGFPNPELDRRFRQIAWRAVANNPHSGVVDANENGVDDAREDKGS